MPFTPDSLATLQEAQLARYRNQLPDQDTHSESFLGKLATAEAGGHWQEQQRMRRIALDAVPQQGSTYEALALWAGAVGLANGAGCWGPKVATPAGGLLAAVGGTNGAVIPDQTPMVGPDGSTLFATQGAATIALGTAALSVNATTPGTVGNLQPTDQLRFVNPPAQVAAAATVTSAPTVPGTDQEGYSDLLGRILDLTQDPQKAITSHDLRVAAEGVAGVYRAYAYPRRDGTGSADVVVTQAGTGAGRAPPSTVQAAVQALFDGTAKAVEVEELRALLPSIGAGRAVRLRLLPATSYPWDWNSAAGTWAVAAYTVTGGVASLTLGFAAPADFQAAVLAGRQPRLQVLATGSVLPQVVAVTGYVVGTLVCALAAPLAIAPTVGDAVHAGSAFVAPIAAAVLGLCDGLGPARAALGAADAALDVWDDTLRIDQLRRVALSAADASGNRYALEFVTAPTIDGAAVDVVAADAGITAPELLVLSAIAVTP